MGGLVSGLLMSRFLNNRLRYRIICSDFPSQTIDQACAVKFSCINLFFVARFATYGRQASGYRRVSGEGENDQ